MQYVVTIDVLHEVFSAFGFVQKIAVFDKNGFQALIQYPDIQTAATAKEALEGHSIYEGGYCKLHLAFSHHTELNVKINNERGRDYTKGNITPTPSSDQPSILGPQPIPNVGAVIQPPHSSVPSGATNAVMPPGVPIPTTPGEPSAAHPPSEPRSQTAIVPSGGPPQYPSEAILQGPPGVPPQFPGYGAPQFAQGSAQAPMVQPSGQGSQQTSSHVNYQLPQGSPQFMQYLSNGSHPVPNTNGPQAMPFPGLGGQQLPPGPQMMQAPGYGSMPFPQRPGQLMPQFPMYSNQQFPPGMEHQMMPFSEQGGQQLPFAPPMHPYNR
uniref:PTBP1-like RNA recognition motif 2 domain-containing protein n=1 Tax=Arundo donax TaxID=35708 RepID=A0A0A9CKM8_ARUDO